MAKCRDCTCCQDKTGRLLAVSESLAGSQVDGAYLAPGFYGVLGHENGDNGDDPKSSTITVTADQVGDSIVLVGSNQSGPVPTSATDSKGNTYSLPVGSHFTIGLDSTVWQLRGNTDGGKLQIGDTITIGAWNDGLGDNNPTGIKWHALDMAGLQGSNPDNIHGQVSGFNFNGSYTLSGGTVAAPGVIVAIAASQGSGGGLSGIETVIADDTCPIGVQGVTDTWPSNIIGVSPVDPAPGWGTGQAVLWPFTTAASVLPLVDTDAFDEDGGAGEAIDPDTGVATPFTYTGIDADTDSLTGVVGLTGFYPDGAIVNVLPHSVIRSAALQIDGEDDLIEARVPHYLYDRIPMQTRDVNASQAYSVLCRLQVDGWIITDVYGETPVVDGSFIDSTTLPVRSDGSPPASSPAPDVVSGDDHLKVRWEAVTQNAAGGPQIDPVHYDVHVTDDATEAPATLDLGTDGGEWTLTAVTPGAAGNDITIEVSI